LGSSETQLCKYITHLKQLAIPRYSNDMSSTSKTPTTILMGLEKGPMQIAAKITGAQPGGLEKDGAPHFTNNDGIPWPDSTHSKTVGGLPLASDTFLFQKQQTFNRSKILERKYLLRRFSLRLD
jgi:hypothetical protein